MAGKDNALKDFWWLIIILIIGGIFWFIRGGPQAIGTGGIKPYLSPPDVSLPTSAASGNNNNRMTTQISASSRTGQATPAPTINPRDSQYKGKVYLKIGTAHRADKASQEYIVIVAQKNNLAAVSLNGWRLENSQAEIFYNVSGQNVQGQDTLIPIPQGVELETFKDDLSRLNPISLKPNETAVVVSGVPPSVSPQIAYSFRVNECSGYLDKLPYHSLTPEINYSCPDARNENGFDQLSQDCADFIRSRYGTSCHTPVIKQDNLQGELYDGKSLPQYCKAYILQHFSYDSCVASHQFDGDFYKPEWRIYLNRVWPLWNNSKEKITLLDNYGKIVDQISYGY